MSIDFFIEMAWKSALISGGALALAQLLRSRAPADRVAVLRLGLSLLLLLPLIAVFGPALQLEAGEAAPAASVLTQAELMLLAASMPAAATPVEPNIWDDPTPLLVLLYLGGLAMIAGRLLIGMFTLRRWTRRAEEVSAPAWLAAFDRALGESDANRDTRLLVSPDIRSPLSWGWKRPVILIDRDSHSDAADADAIMAHELAHIERGDWLTLVLARLAVALFWFNPLVHLVERAMLHHAEEAADAAALGQVEPTRYAQILLNCAGGLKVTPVPANSMASGALSRRVRSILDGTLRRNSAGSLWTLGAMVATIAAAAPLAALELIAPEAPQAPVAPAAPAAPQAPGAAAAPGTPRAPDAPLTPATPVTPVLEEGALVSLPQSLRGLAATIVGARIPVAPTPPVRGVAPVPPVPGVAPMPPLPVGPHFAFVQGGPKSSHFAFIDEEAKEAMREAFEVAAEQARLGALQAELGDKIAREVAMSVRENMEHGARGMEAGADHMDRGADHMRDEARRLRSRDYRERQIAKARAEGREVTHEELIESIDDLIDGAEEMRDGAREMRQAAKEMRQARM